MKAKRQRQISLLLCLSISVVIHSTMVYAAKSSLNTLVENFARTMEKKHNFKASEIKQILKQAKKKPKIIKAITRPAESKPWHVYRKLFITDQRIRRGVNFWNKHHKTLAKAEDEYGVAPEVILGIIGVETRFGFQKGGYRVLDALYTLGFHYPRRGKYFRSELANFLVMARNEKLDPLKVKGSYAGALGWPQFMPSSYLRYAVDFDGNGQRDLLNSVDDAIGSVANYLSKHGWQTGQDIAIPVKVRGKSYRQVIKWGIKPKKTIHQLKRLGIRPLSAANKDLPAALFDLQYRKERDYWLGLKNFYVITRYNPSKLYAMAVTQLGQEVKQNRAHQNIKLKKSAKKK